MHRLRFTTLVEAPLTVAFDVARTLGRPWPWPLQEVVSVRPVRDVYSVGPGSRWRWLTHSRRFTATGAGTLVDEQVDWETGLPGVLGTVVDELLLRRRVIRAMQAHLDAYAAAAARRALDVVQVVGAAVVDGRPGARGAAVRRPVRRLLGVPRRQGRGGGVRAVGAGPRVRGGARRRRRPPGVPRRGRARRRRRRRDARRLHPARLVGPAGGGGAGRARARRSALGAPRTSWTRSTGSPPTAHCSPP